ncbi:MAG: hypothetical protein RMJ18_00725 [Candidatus Aenigmarchaeota archaeon]|nr:hypothetical protein [Candidatus Aenigmarchaeota archaeon]MDW8159932.1 hypothetical protein [Candidatus Aenigmarchaeota archaeon]
MHPLIKALMGVIIVVASIYYIFAGIPGYLKPALSDVLVVLNGAIPIFVLLIGVFIIWLEWDEWKIERELAKEEKEAEKKEKRAKRKK